MPTVPLSRQIAEVRRELEVRRRQRLTDAQARSRLTDLEAVLSTLLEIAEPQTTLFGAPARHAESDRG